MILELWMVGVAIAVLLFIRVPVGLAFIGPFLWYAIADGRSAGFSLKTAFDGINSFPLLAVPLFILVGVMANRLGIADRLYDFCLAALGRVRGNLAYVNVASAVGFSWMSGSALADVAGLGKMQIPQMIRAGYPVWVRRRADGVVVADQPGDSAEHPGRDLCRDGGGVHRCDVRGVDHSRVHHGIRSLCLHLHLDGAPARSRPGAIFLATARGRPPYASSARCSRR